RAACARCAAVRKADGTFDTTPDPDAELNLGDVLIAVGTQQELNALEELFAPQEAVAGEGAGGAPRRGGRSGGRARAAERSHPRRLRHEHRPSPRTLAQARPA